VFARVLHTKMGDQQIDPGTFIRENVVPRARQQQGLKKAFWLVDTKNRRGLNVALFETLEDIEANAEALRQVQQRATEATGVTFADVEIYELVAEI